MCPSLLSEFSCLTSRNLTKQTVILQDFHFFPLEAFAWLPHSTTLQRQTKMLSSLFVMRKINGKLITGPHSAFKYKPCCISVRKCKKLWNQVPTSKSLLCLQVVKDAKSWNWKIPAVTRTYLQIIRWHSSLWFSTEYWRAESTAWCWSRHGFKNTKIQN